MRFKIFAVLVGVAFLATLSIPALSQEEKADEAKYEYIGAKKCIMCHKKDGTGPSWEESAHATAFDKLTDEQKADPVFLKYYTTGKDDKGELLEGVQCEACHGPGSEYKSMKIMKDREASIAAGLVIPSEETCMGCHGAEDAPAAVKAVAKDWNYEKALSSGVHAMPAEEEGK